LFEIGGLFTRCASLVENEGLLVEPLNQDAIFEKAVMFVAIYLDQGA